ncbi:MAG: hypothetical protein A2099_06820 [Planctomycetes bacterium GWF2_39_10]|nr:MAG: hypothetical protein A2099_06820 [Planctomycetes bacterium GWF2_39_10]
MKRRTKLFGGIVVLFVLCSGCAHNVAFQKPDAYKYETAIPLKAGFYMDKILKEKIYSGRAFSSGIENRWDVPIGDTIHTYAVSYLKNGFVDFSEIEDMSIKQNCDVVIKVDDINYYMEDQAAHCDVSFVIENISGKQVFNKKYHADGPSGYVNVILAGPFAQKSAIRQSTHVVLENIFKDFMNDVRTNFVGWK